MKVYILLTTLLLACGCASRLEGEAAIPELSSEQIHSAFERDSSKIFSIYNKALKSSPELGGKIVFIISALYDEANECNVKYADSGLESISEEICTVIQGMDFGYGNNLNFSYPIIFSHDSKFN